MSALEQPAVSGFTLHLPPEPMSIAVARSAVRRVTTFVDGDAASAFLVALTEIISNAIDEHVRLELEDGFTVEMIIGAVDLVVVTDRGGGIDVEALMRDAGTQPVSDESGRGLSIARAFVPNLAFESGPDGTIATLPLEGFGIVR